MVKQNKAPLDVASAQIERFGGLITLKEGAPTESKDRLISCNAYTGAIVDRYDYWTGERYKLQLSIEGCDLSRVAAKAVPVLDDHMAYGGSEAVVGIVEDAYVADNMIKADVRFSMDPEVDSLWNKIQEGIIASVSVGAKIGQLTDISGENDKIKTYLATKWTLMEISPTGIPADASAGFLSAQLGRDTINLSKLVADSQEQQPEQLSEAGAQAQKEETMAEATNPQPAVTSPPPAQAAQVLSIEDAKRQADEAAKLAETRVSTFFATLAKHNLKTDLANQAVAEKWSVEKFQAEVLNALATREEEMGQQKTHHSARITVDSREKFRGSAINALLHIDRPDQIKLEGGREFIGMSLLEIAKECLAQEGKSHRGMNKEEIARLAMTTADFPFITENVASKSLRAGYEAFPQTYKAVARQVTVADFKPMSMPLLDGTTSLQAVNEHGEFKMGKLFESKSTVRVTTFGEIIPITRQTIINDDKQAFSRVPFLMGQKAYNLESDTVWNIIIANANMSDGVPIFHATHRNLGTASAVTSDAISALRALIRKQKGLDNGSALNYTPRYIIGGADLETDIAKVLTSITPATSANVVPDFIRSMTPVIEPRLDVSSGAKPWYVSADPSQGDGLVYAYLEGQQGVFTQTEMGFDVDGIKIKARLDFGAAMIDFRTWARNPGV